MSTRQQVLEASHSEIAPWNKGIGLLEHAVDSSEVVQLGWNLLHEDLSLPAAVLYEDRLRHNLDWMQQFIAAYGLKLAPHGKTTMAPKLFDLQLHGGAWGITLATPHQVFAAYSHGVRRILMANQLVGKANRSLIARLLQNREFEYYCLVDSAELVDQLGAFFSSQGLRLNVLIEIGVTGGRAGVRDEEQLEFVLSALERWREAVVLCGVELYEGVLSDEAAIRALLARGVAVARKLAAEKRFQRTPFLLSGAGSAWYDVVAEVFSAAGFGDSAEIVLRPGCYLTHDAGSYRKAQARILANNPIARHMHSGLVTALHVWAYVQSVPEPGKAIIGMGRRDAAFDSGLPVPALHFRPGDVRPKPAPGHWQITKLMDQHAFLQIGAAGEVCVGDMIGFDICHPCLTFDKWRTIPVLNADYQVIDMVETLF